MKKALLMFVSLWYISICGSPVLHVPPCTDRKEEGCTSNEDVVAGIVRIKVIPGVAPLPEGAFQSGESHTGIPELDEALASLGATEISAVFNEGGRFAARRRRYGLHLWYEVRIDESISPVRAAKILAGLQVVELAEPVRPIRLSKDSLTGGRYDMGQVKR